MDYKEKYKQALSKAKDMLNYKEVRREDMEYLFPELKESEDEKIRKEIVRFIQMEVEDEIVGNKWLAWLGKQGNYANFRDKAQVGDRITKNEDGVLVNLSQLKRVAKPSEKQGKQKFEMKTAEESLGIDSDTYNKIVDECIYGDDKVEPKFKVGDKIYLKPEYRMPNDDTPIANTVKEIRRIDDKHYRFDGSYIFIEDQDKYELVEQKPEENKGNIGGISANWSEEDKDFMYDTLSNLTELKDRYGEGYGNVGKCIDWLKSLRPQNQWKPSELQLGCLSDAIEHYNSLGYPASKLKELLNDLKKLKEGKV